MKKVEKKLKLTFWQIWKKLKKMKKVESGIAREVEKHSEKSLKKVEILSFLEWADVYLPKTWEFKGIVRLCCAQHFRSFPETSQRLPRDFPDSQRLPRDFPETPQRLPRDFPETSLWLPRDPKTWPCGGNGKRSWESDFTMVLAASCCLSCI